MAPYFYLLFGLWLASLILSIGILLGVIIGSFGTLGYLYRRLRHGLPIGVVVWVILLQIRAYPPSPYPEQEGVYLPAPPPLLEGGAEDEF